jgi:hypothetical protein
MSKETPGLMPVPITPPAAARRATGDLLEPPEPSGPHASAYARRGWDVQVDAAAFFAGRPDLARFVPAAGSGAAVASGRQAIVAAAVAVLLAVVLMVRDWRLVAWLAGRPAARELALSWYPEPLGERRAAAAGVLRPAIEEIDRLIGARDWRAMLDRARALNDRPDLRARAGQDPEVARWLAEVLVAGLMIDGSVRAIDTHRLYAQAADAFRSASAQLADPGFRLRYCGAWALHEAGGGPALAPEAARQVLVQVDELVSRHARELAQADELARKVEKIEVQALLSILASSPVQTPEDVSLWRRLHERIERWSERTTPEVDADLRQVRIRFLEKVKGEKSLFSVEVRIGGISYAAGTVRSELDRLRAIPGRAGALE